MPPQWPLPLLFEIMYNPGDSLLSLSVLHFKFCILYHQFLCGFKWVPANVFIHHCRPAVHTKFLLLLFYCMIRHPMPTTTCRPGECRLVSAHPSGAPCTPATCTEVLYPFLPKVSGILSIGLICSRTTSVYYPRLCQLCFAVINKPGPCSEPILM